MIRAFLLKEKVGKMAPILENDPTHQLHVYHPHVDT